jgi:hypothetical protein
MDGWLASKGDARFAWTGLRGAARSVGVVQERLGLSLVQGSATLPKKGRGADGGCTAAIGILTRLVGEMRGADAEAEAEAEIRKASKRGFWNGCERRRALVPKPSTASFHGCRRQSLACSARTVL